NDFNPVDFYEKKLVAFFDNIFSQDYKSAFRRKCGIHVFRKFEFMKTGIEVPILKKQLEAKNNTDYKIENLSQEIDNMRQTVVNYKINNFLSYKLGFAMYKLKNNIFYMLVMLFIIKKNHLFFQENRINKRLYRHLGKMAIFAYKNWYNNQGVRALKKIIKMLKSV
ncbi:hypothetical protein DXS81_07650, partial [Campylobacter coli]|nr:hypothetical protein [Campylobacter coli]